jgi:HNH endonuclease
VSMLAFPAREEHGCIVCGRIEKLTDEHIFPAALGGEDVVRDATCQPCNALFSHDFEAAFVNALKPLCYILRIGNREGEIPSIETTAKIDDREFKVILHPDGGMHIQDKKEERILDSGVKEKRYWLFSKGTKEQLESRAARRGERVEIITGNGRPIEFEPESFMALDFIGSQEALRTATKIAFMALVYKVGRRFAMSPALDAVRRHLHTGKDQYARLFVNRRFSDKHQIGPHQHAASVHCDGQQHTIYAVIIFFGGLAYLVQLSSDYQGADYGFTYAFDALERKEAPVIVQSFEMNGSRLRISVLLILASMTSPRWRNTGQHSLLQSANRT